MDSKRVIAGSLVVGLMVTVLSACGNKDKKEDNNVDYISHTAEEKKENTIDTKVSRYDGKILISDRLDDVYRHLELTNGNKHLGDVIDFARSPVDVSNYPAILHKDQQGASDVFRMLGIADTDLSEFAIAMTPMSDRAYSVMVLKPADGKKEVLKAGLDKLKYDTDKLFSEKLPDQSEIAKSAIINEIGDYIVFVMCNDYNEVSDSIENALTNQYVLNTYIEADAESFQIISDNGIEHAVKSDSLNETVGYGESVGVEASDSVGTSDSVSQENSEVDTTEIGGIEVDNSKEPTDEAQDDAANISDSNNTSTDWQ